MVPQDAQDEPAEALLAEIGQQEQSTAQLVSLGEAMIIPADAIIPHTKLTHYLLVSRRRNDKSQFLAQVGFTQDNPGALEAAIRRHIAGTEAVSDRENEYGRYYTVTGELRGPDGTLAVTTVWIYQDAQGGFRFVTLKPAR